jgi:hypothetical protein
MPGGSQVAVSVWWLWSSAPFTSCLFSKQNTSDPFDSFYPLCPWWQWGGCIVALNLCSLHLVSFFNAKYVRSLWSPWFLRSLMPWWQWGGCIVALILCSLHLVSFFNAKYVRSTRSLQSPRSLMPWWPWGDSDPLLPLPRVSLKSEIRPIPSIPSIPYVRWQWGGYDSLLPSPRVNGKYVRSPWLIQNVPSGNYLRWFRVFICSCQSISVPIHYGLRFLYPSNSYAQNCTIINYDESSIFSIRSLWTNESRSTERCYNTHSDTCAYLNNNNSNSNH